LGADGVTGGEDQNADIGTWMKPGDQSNQWVTRQLSGSMVSA
jgi:hypothetical protein